MRQHMHIRDAQTSAVREQGMLWTAGDTTGVFWCQTDLEATTDQLGHLTVFIAAGDAITFGFCIVKTLGPLDENST